MAVRRTSMPINNHVSRSASEHSFKLNPSPIYSSRLSKSFAEIIKRYKDYSQHIQRLLKETEKSYSEIDDTHVLTAGMGKIFITENMTENILFL